MNILFNGVLDQTNVPFGGLRESFTVAQGDRIDTQFKAGGGYGYQMLVVGASPSSPMLRWQNAKIFHSTVFDHFAKLGYQSASMGNRVVFYSTNYSVLNDDIGLIHNPGLSAPDTDGDGLADVLENELGTCATNQSFAGNWNCSTKNSVDTDNDGLNDYVETFGDFTLGSWSYRKPAIDVAPLPLWGGDPLQKDVFVEVDFEDFVSSPLKDSVNEDWLLAASAIYGEGTSLELENPNGEDGIRLHFDVQGAVPESSSSNPMILFDGGGSNEIPEAKNCSDRHALRQSEQTAVRQKYMRYLCTYPGSGGQASRPGLTLKGGIHVRTIMHELGHNLGLSHGGRGPYNGVPHYRSLMNYAYGYHDPVRFSKGAFNAYPLNPSSLSETSGVGPNNSWLTLAPWSFTTSGNAVDWNRNGVIDSGTTQYAISWVPNEGTSAFTAFQDKRTVIAPFPNPNNTPSLVRYTYGNSDWIYMFHTVGSESQSEKVRYSYMRVTSDGRCTNHTNKALNPSKTSCGTWKENSSANTSAWFGKGVAAAMHQGPNDIGPRLYILVRRPSGEVWLFKTLPYPTGELDNAWVIVKKFGIGWSSAVGDPDLISHGNALRMVWRNASNDVIQAHMGTNGYVNGPMNTGVKSLSDPSIAYNPQTARAQLAIITSSNEIDILRSASNFSGLYWTQDAANDPGSIKATTRKLGIAWDDSGGFLMVGYLDLARSVARVLRFESAGMRNGLMGDAWFKPLTGIDLIDFEGDDNIHGAF